MQNISFKTSGKELQVNKESNLLRMSIRYEGEIPYKCGGGICGTCVVKVERGAGVLTDPSRKEIQKLGEELLSQGYRLACQTFVNGDIAINWDENPLLKKKKAVAK
ncbi:2Fe-2S iron-sulfur cluster-binding protein [Aneurinibacillus tyrosinisolvens]|uniref:2Fe-2S iron-sulfur cluster-binding protein n=1 Tax=Aneurinibacillus tyrosinisolvens TaxID=1443435 RepID=UPI00063F2A46|nr:2Fe-2S iron-sulfur cluster binding domain-containing protein [Aneurinibacillus tyrosinisolvens]